MTREQVDEIVEQLGLIDLGDAILYLDEAGFIEAAFSVRKVECRTCTAVAIVRESSEKACA